MNNSFSDKIDETDKDNNDMSIMDPFTGVEIIIKKLKNFGNLLDKARDPAKEASNLISKTRLNNIKYNINDWYALSNIKDLENPDYYKLDENYKNFVLVDIRNAPTICCQGCGIKDYKVPERPLMPNEIVLKEENSNIVYIMDTNSVCSDCLPDMSVVTVISHSWEPRKQRLYVRAVGTGSSKVYLTKKIIAALQHIDGWIWVDTLCNQSSADGNMRTRMYATCKLGVFTEEMKGLFGEMTGWHQRLWCLIEAMYCRKIAIIVIGKAEEKDENIHINKIKNMYGWFYATCRLLRMSLNDRNVRQKVIHWGNTNWIEGRTKAANQLRVNVTTAAIGWLAGVPSTLPGRCICPKNGCITEALINYAYTGTHYGCDITQNGVKIGLSPRLIPDHKCDGKHDTKYWFTGKNKILFKQISCDHVIKIDSATITIPSGDWYVYENNLQLHCVETLPNELHMEQIRTILYIEDTNINRNNSQIDYCVGNKRSRIN